MSNALAIGGVTAVMKALLEGSGSKSVVDTAVGTFDVSTSPPDKLAETDKNLLNLFLFQAVENSALRNSSFPSRSANGDRLTNPPLALDATVLVSAYGEHDYFAEILLGYALHVFHESPVLTRDRIRTTLNGSSTDPNWPSNFSSTGLADQLEEIKIIPRSISVEEMSRIWASFQTGYRPTAMFQVSVVLIEAEYPSISSLPVLSIGEVVEKTVGGATVRREAGVVAQASLTPPLPTLEEVEPPNENQHALVLGDTLALTGYHLEDPDRARFTHELLDDPLEITAFTKVSANRLELALPDTPGDWPPGFYRVEVVATQDGIQRTTNQLAFVLAPVVDSGGISAARAADGSIEITVNPKPQVRPEQEVFLIVGSTVIPAEARADTTDPIVFRHSGLDAGDYWFRLRVDGVDSLLIDYASSPLKFNDSQKVSIPS